MSSPSADSAADVAATKVSPAEASEPAPASDESPSSVNVLGHQVAVGSKILAYHGPLLYTAKVLDVELDPKTNEGVRFFLHYDGWKQKWDEWVDISRVLPDTEENRALQKSIKQNPSLSAQQPALPGAGGSKKRVSNASAGGGEGSASKKRKKIDSTTSEMESEAEEAAAATSAAAPATADKPAAPPAAPPAEEEDAADPFGDPAIKLPLPDELKQVIVRDWDNLMTNNMRLKLRRRLSVTAVFADFLGTKRKQTNAVIAAQVCDGLAVYLERAIPTLLLYACERDQYESIVLEEGQKYADVYGPELLLRLFVRLPRLLAQTDLKESDLLTLQHRLQEFLKFLAKHSGEYFVEDEAYEPSGEAPAEEEEPAEEPVAAEPSAAS